MKIQRDKKNLWYEATPSKIEYFSYATLVAVYDELTNELYLTDIKYSVTTSRHMTVIRKRHPQAIIKELNQLKKVQHV